MDNVSMRLRDSWESSSVRGGALETLSYEDYAPEVLVRQFLITGGPTSEGTHAAYFGLSPFDIPEAVAVELSSDDHCIFRFTYPNAEPPERDVRRLPSDSHVTLLLAEHTKKILQVHLSEARARLQNANLDLDVGVFQDIARQLPAEAIKACLRNATLIRAILRNMPSGFREDVVAKLDELVRTRALVRR